MESIKNRALFLYQIARDSLDFAIYNRNKFFFVVMMNLILHYFAISLSNFVLPKQFIGLVLTLFISLFLKGFMQIICVFLFTIPSHGINIENFLQFVSQKFPPAMTAIIARTVILLFLALIHPIIAVFAAAALVFIEYCVIFQSYDIKTAMIESFKTARPYLFFLIPAIIIFVFYSLQITKMHLVMMAITAVCTVIWEIYLIFLYISCHDQLNYIKNNLYKHKI